MPVAILKRGGVGVLLTDTIYGLVGRALHKKAVERIYRIKGRNPNKPLIILISSVRDIARFGIVLDVKTKQILRTVWPGRVSVIVPCPSQRFAYLHRGTKTLAFRLPKKPSLLALLRRTGPLVAPSANPEGLPPACNVTEAKKYFGDNVDFYLAGGRPQRNPSTLITIKDGEIISLRR